MTSSTQTSTDTTDPNSLPERNGGGTGNAGGTEVHAMAMVLAAANMMRGTKIGWLEGVTEDIPVAVTAETGGPGDDIGLELVNGEKVEVQCKKNLQRGSELWQALDALALGIEKDVIQCGLLAITPDSSGSIRNKLAADIVKIGQGSYESLTEIGEDFLNRLKAANRDPKLCAKIRIQTLDLLQAQGADRRIAIEALRGIFVEPDQSEAAYAHLYRDAIAAMRLRGRWTIPALVGFLRSYGIALREDSTPAGVVAKLTRWAEAAQANFTLPGALNTLSIREMLPARLMITTRDVPDEIDASAALERYHAHKFFSIGDTLINGEWAGRFHRLNVVVSGPGLGKTTLSTRIAWEYAVDGIPALIVPLKRVAAAVENGMSIETAIELHGLSGSGVEGVELRRARSPRVVIVADALDEAGKLHDELAKGLVGYAAGHPEATIIVTTRPIGYETARLADWRHYRLEGPDEKKGGENLGRLIAATRGLPVDDSASRDLAERELAKTAARHAIARSPLLLGMSATLIARNEKLPATRPAMYEAMVKLFEERDTATPDEALSCDEAARILDIIGWHLTDNPLLTWDSLKSIGQQQLAQDLARQPLAVSSLFERGFDHWERAGIVERVYHSGTCLVTFVHKTFGEFAAARFLVTMADDRTIELERIVDTPALGEIVAFAGALGLGNELAQLFVDRRARGAAGQFERALELAGDRDAKVDDEKIRELATIALEIANSNTDDRFAVGLKLAALAGRRRTIVGPIAQARLDDANDDVRLVAWATAVAAGTDYYDPTRLDQLLVAFVPMVVSAEPRRRSGILPNPLGNDVDLIQQIALAALRAKPADEKLAYVDTMLSDRPFTTWGFTSSVKMVLGGEGIDTSEVMFGRKGAIVVPLLGQNDAWSQAANRAMHSLASAAIGADDGNTVKPAYAGRYPQFSALVRLAGLWETEASDVFKWAKPFDQNAVAEAVRGLIAASAIDGAQLSVEAREVRDRLEAEHHIDLHSELGNPDVPEVVWGSVRDLPFDRAKIEIAFRHGSAWMLSIAANLLAVLPLTRHECKRVLQEAQGIELFYASQVVAHHLPEVDWRDFVLERLAEDVPDGGHHLLEALATATVKMPAKTRYVIEHALQNDDPRVVEAAAKLAVRWIGLGGILDIELAIAAFHKKLHREGAIPGAVVSTEYRAELLKLMIAADAIHDTLLEDLRKDPSPKVCAIAEEEIVRRQT